MRTPLLAALAALVGFGCVTPYGPMGFTGGYRDRKISDGVYRIEVAGNGFTSAWTLEEYFERRAKELCHKAGYTRVRTDFGVATSQDPSSFSVRRTFGGARIEEEPGARKSSVSGVAYCSSPMSDSRSAPTSAPPPETD